MSRKKINQEINYDVAVARLKDFLRIENNKQLAELFEISEADFSNRKRKGTLLPLIINLGLNQSININWILSGSGSPTEIDPADPERADLLRMTCEILESDGSYARSISANIRSFHEAVTTARELAVIKKDQATMKKEMAQLKKYIHLSAERTRRDDPPEKKDEILKERAISLG